MQLVCECRAELYKHNADHCPSQLGLPQICIQQALSRNQPYQEIGLLRITAATGIYLNWSHKTVPQLRPARGERGRRLATHR